MFFLLMQEVLVACASSLLPHSQQLVAPSDIIRGHVMMTRPHGVFVRVTSFKHSFKNRELTDLKIKVQFYFQIHFVICKTLVIGSGNI